MVKESQKLDLVVSLMIMNEKLRRYNFSVPSSQALRASSNEPATNLLVYNVFFSREFVKFILHSTFT